ncbi:MAG: T9SS type A sorting domain-containing protein [Chitinophagales bacterium]|nr:T9SS type A sorting domain-containing protein [Chitinophagales bacterium]
MQLVNVTVANNRRKDGGEIYGSGIKIESEGYLICFNSIFWNPNINGDVVVSDEAYAGFDYCDIRDGYTGTGNINADPLFVSDTDFHLIPNSPCIGIGNLADAPTFDIENSPRPLPSGTNPDLGCYEMDIAVMQEFEIIAWDVYFYPNPATDYITIPTEPNEAAKIEIHDAFGRLVMQSTLHLNQNTLPVAELLAGFYFLTIDSKGKRVAGRFVKM